MIGLMGSATPAWAGSWTLDAGTGTLVFTGAAMQSNDAFDSGSKLRASPRYSKDEAQVLIEYGVTNWFTAMFAPSLQRVDIGNSRDKVPSLAPRLDTLKRRQIRSSCGTRQSVTFAARQEVRNV